MEKGRLVSNLDKRYANNEPFAHPKLAKEPRLEWQKWILNLDKYIDPKYQPTKHRYSLYAGLVLCPLFLLVMLLMGVPRKTALALLVALLIIGTVFLQMNGAFWRKQRIFEQRFIKRNLMIAVVIAIICQRLANWVG